MLYEEEKCPESSRLVALLCSCKVGKLACRLQCRTTICWALSLHCVRAALIFFQCCRFAGPLDLELECTRGVLSVLSDSVSTLQRRSELIRFRVLRFTSRLLFIFFAFAFADFFDSKFVCFGSWSPPRPPACRLTLPTARPGRDAYPQQLAAA